jgi:DNA-binding transcriptional LysR family regulator
MVFVAYMSLPPLAAFRFFNIAAQTTSFAQAAQQLNVTQAAVSRQIRLLEEALGVALFDRRNRAVFLNAAGKTLYKVTSPLFEQLETTVYHLQRAAREDVLVVSCEPTIAMKWLIPRLPDFKRRYPQVQVQLLTAGGPIDFTKAGVDLAIRRNDFHWAESLYSATICDEWVGPVCAPSTPDIDPSLKGACLLITQSRPLAWQHWFHHQNTTGEPTTLLEYEHFYLCIQAAVAGQGFTLASRLMVEGELSSGQLVAPFGFSRDGSHYTLLSPVPLAKGPKGLIFHRWLVEQAQASACEPNPASQTHARAESLPAPIFSEPHPSTLVG